MSFGTSTLCNVTKYIYFGKSLISRKNTSFDNLWITFTAKNGKSEVNWAKSKDKLKLIVIMWIPKKMKELQKLQNSQSYRRNP